MDYLVINTPNGIKGSKTLNDLASKLKKKYSKSPNIQIGFDMGFDGVWELIIQNTKTDMAMVLKPSNRAKDATEVFGYFRSFSTQLQEDELACVRNNQLEAACVRIISLMSKNN
jgi:hypothetical protein